MNPVLFSSLGLVLCQLDRTPCMCGSRESLVKFIWIGFLSGVPNVAILKSCHSLVQECQSARDHSVFTRAGKKHSTLTDCECRPPVGRRGYHVCFLIPIFVPEWDGTMRFKTPFASPFPHVASVVNGRKVFVLRSFSEVSKRRQGVSRDRKPVAGAV